jgi:hypothetical protein
MAVCHEDGIFIVKTNRWHSRIASTGKRNFRKQALRRQGCEDEPQDCGTVTNQYSLALGFEAESC